MVENKKSSRKEKVSGLLRSFKKSSKGQGMVEYGLILALVSVLAIGAVGNVGEGVKGAFDKVAVDSGLKDDAGVVDPVDPVDPGEELPDPEPEPEPEPEETPVDSGVTVEGVKFLGEVPASELFTGAELSSETGVTEGTIHHNDESWLKFDDNGTILLVAKKTYRYGISWKHLNSKGVVDGTKKVTKDGQTYKVRLLTGLHSEAKTEWNRLMYPIHANNQNLDHDFGTLTHTLGTGGGRYTDKDLHVEAKAKGGTSWVQEVPFATSGIGRGGHLAKPGLGLQMGDVKVTSFKEDGYGWRPVLELVK